MSDGWQHKDDIPDEFFNDDLGEGLPDTETDAPEWLVVPREGSRESPSLGRTLDEHFDERML